LRKASTIVLAIRWPKLAIWVLRLFVFGFLHTELPVSPKTIITNTVQRSINLEVIKEAACLIARQRFTIVEKDLNDGFTRYAAQQIQTS
jgi:hypothetical protein